MPGTRQIKATTTAVACSQTPRRDIQANRSAAATKMQSSSSGIRRPGSPKMRKSKYWLPATFKAMRASEPRQKDAHARSGLPRASLYEIAKYAPATAAAKAIDQTCPGLETSFILSSVTRTYDGVSQKALSPQARTATAAARTHTRQSRSASQTDQARIGK